MAYLSNSSIHSDNDGIKNFLLDIEKRKEFASLQVDSNNKIKPNRLSGLRLHSAQLFVRNFLSPYTDYDRILLNWQTGAGKTIAMIEIAEQFIKVYRSFFNIKPQQRPTILVLGFSRTIIQAELLRHPEFGYVSLTELNNLKRLQYQVRKGTIERTYLTGFIGKLKQRLSNRLRGGYYKFRGYKEFANRLFLLTKKGQSEKFDVQKMFNRKMYDESDELRQSNELKLQIDQYVEDGYIKINQQIVDEVRKGMIVADEIHNVYNIRDKNNYGIALQYILDIFDGTKDAPRVVLMSATPMSGSATEIVDLLNLLVPRKVITSVLKRPGAITKNDLFKKNKIGKISELLPNSINIIGQLSAGRVSFLLDTNIQMYPKRIFEGEKLDNIPYLKFITCPMSELHYKTLVHEAKLKRGDKEETVGEFNPYIKIAINRQSLYDIVFPNPNSSEIGMYDSHNIINNIDSSPTIWKSENAINTIKVNAYDRITGNFLHLDNIGKYSTKYKVLIEQLINDVKKQHGKIMVYHHLVQTSGVLLIEELLKMNGFIDKTSGSGPNTLCAKCGIQKVEHNSKGEDNHLYTPARFISAHYQIDKSLLEKDIKEFNDVRNADGNHIMVVIGSKIIREGYNILSTRRQYIVSMPTDIPTLIQIFGRVIRKDSHINLPAEKRDVVIKILVSDLPESTIPEKFIEAPELKRYRLKMDEYQVIQEAERPLKVYSIDSSISYNAVSRALQVDGKNMKSLLSLPYSPILPQNKLSMTLNKNTFNAYGYNEEEIMLIADIIKNLFLSQNIWKFEDLWDAVRNSNQTIGGVYHNSQLFDKENFIISLNNLQLENKFKHFLIPPIINNRAITFVDPFYILVPIDNKNKPIIDIDSFLQTFKNEKPLQINVSNHIQLLKTTQIFDLQLNRIMTMGPSYDIRYSLFDYDSHFHTTALIYIIESQFGKAEKIYNTEKIVLDKLKDLYNRYKIFINISDIKDESNLQMKPANLSLVKNKKFIVGFIETFSVKMFNGEDWYELPRSSFGIKRRYNENDIIIGFSENVNGKVSFKIRPPIQKLQNSKVKDIRSVQRGIACESANRKYQRCLACKLGIYTRSSVIGIRMNKLCHDIREFLLDNEEKSRNCDDTKSFRWIYLFNEKRPVITLSRFRVGKKQIRTKIEIILQN